jgi:hypothetical protein
MKKQLLFIFESGPHTPVFFSRARCFRSKGVIPGLYGLSSLASVALRDFHTGLPHLFRKIFPIPAYG